MTFVEVQFITRESMLDLSSEFPVAFRAIRRAGILLALRRELAAINAFVRSAKQDPTARSPEPLVASGHASEGTLLAGETTRRRKQSWEGLHLKSDERDASEAPLLGYKREWIAARAAGMPFSDEGAWAFSNAKQGGSQAQALAPANGANGASGAVKASPHATTANHVQDAPSGQPQHSASSLPPAAFSPTESQAGGDVRAALARIEQMQQLQSTEIRALQQKQSAEIHALQVQQAADSKALAESMQTIVAMAERQLAFQVQQRQQANGPFEAGRAGGLDA